MVCLMPLGMPLCCQRVIAILSRIRGRRPGFDCHCKLAQEQEAGGPPYSVLRSSAHSMVPALLSQFAVIQVSLQRADRTDCALSKPRRVLGDPICPVCMNGSKADGPPERSSRASPRACRAACPLAFSTLTVTLDVAHYWLVHT